MNKQISPGLCLGIVVSSAFFFTLIAGMFSSYTATAFLGSYVAYLIVQLIFFYIFRAIYKSKTHGWPALLAFIGFAAIPAFLAVATRYSAPPANMLAPCSAFIIFIAGWWMYFAVRKNSASTTQNLDSTMG